ncbi:MAG TPA: SDR family NAD(P)-dependent oxidoreductase [Candidatus Dormibacteraeota bacterium]
MELEGKVCVVTGGARGIGAALAAAARDAGAKEVVVADILPGEGVVHCDVSRETDVMALVERVEAKHGRIDVFFSNAGIAVGGGAETADADWERIWRVNTLAHVYVARQVVPTMLEQGEGYLVGTVSAAGLLNHVTAMPYGVTKAAALSLFEWLSINYHDRGLRVSVLCPQGVKTDMLGFGDSMSHHLAQTALEPAQVALAVLQAMGEERFLILPHPEVARYMANRANDNERWLRGMRRLRASL